MRSHSLSANLEDYLEAIWHIEAEHGVVRAMEVAERLGVKRPSVTSALHSLAEKGYIHYEPRSFINLSEKGKAIAQCVDRRHHILSDLFTQILGLAKDDAEEAACKMEHGMDSQVCKQLTSLLLARDNNEELSRLLEKEITHYSRRIDCEQSCNYPVTHTPAKSASRDACIFDLNSLEIGVRGIISRILGVGDFQRRLREMGVTSGQEIVKLGVAPLNGPVQVKIRNYRLSIRREEASNILVRLS